MALQKTEKEVKGKKYYNANLKDLDYNTSCTFKLSFDSPREGKSQYNKDDGTPKPVYHYAVEVLEPALGQLTFSFVPERVHRDLQQFRKGETVKVTATIAEFERTLPNGSKVKKPYKAFKVERVELAMNDADRKTVVETIKALPQKPDEVTLRQLLKDFGYTKETDIQSIISELQ